MPAAAEPPNVVAAPPGPSAEQVAARAAQTQVSASSIPPPVEPLKPPKPGSAKAKLFSEMQKKFGGEEAQPAAQPRTQAKADKSADLHPAETAPEQAEGADQSPVPSATTPAATPPAEPQPGKKVSPWKLVDQFKERAAKAEARILELEKQVVPDEKVKESLAKYEAMQKRMQEMEEDLRFSHSEKYDPEVLKSKQDYERAFARAMAELKEVTVEEGGQQRPLNANDLAELAFMPLGQAQSVAKQLFGDLAPYIMDQRNEIRRLWDERQSKVEDLKKNGAERERQKAETRQKSFQELNDFITQTYQQANKEAVEDPKHGQYFKPRESDPEWNSRLEKGFKLVDESYAKSPTDPKLSPEQRKEVIRRHAAIRNRAAGWGALRHENEVLRKELSEVRAKLKEFKDTTPSAGGRTSDAVPEKPRGMKGLMADLQKIAH